MYYPPESPLSASSANESPLPEPPVDLDSDRLVATHDDWDDLPYLYRQPVAAPLPLNLSLAMGYGWSPEVKKFQPYLDDYRYSAAAFARQQDMLYPPDPFGPFPSSLDLALQYPQPAPVPVLSAPVPRHSAYLSASLLNHSERTCQEQEHQEPHALRALTQGLQEQPTVRPAEVSPVIPFAALPDGDEDAEGEPDVDPLCLHGHSTAQYDYPPNFIRGSGTPAGATADVDAAIGDYDYRPEQEDDDDGDFDPPTSKNTRTLRPRAVAGRSRYHPYDLSSPALDRSPLIPASDISPAQPPRIRKNTRTLPVPVPVPNLTKKSRGRRVPTVNNGRGQRDAALGARIYLCDVSGCGKCFARGEHLKRHIRSIHTYEKPHKCPYPGCGKEFSRHDNLGQHMKVHKDLPKLVERRGEA